MGLQILLSKVIRRNKEDNDPNIGEATDKINDFYFIFKVYCQCSP